MALKAGSRSRSSFCPSPRSALGAQPRLWSGQIPKKEHTPKSRNPCQWSPARATVREAGKGLDEKREVQGSEESSQTMQERTEPWLHKGNDPGPGVFALPDPLPFFSMLHGPQATSVVTGKDF